MKPFTDRDRILDEPREKRRPIAPLLGLVLLLGMVFLLAFLAWPYVTLWQIDRAARSDDVAALSELVDLDAIRGEIKKKLNKETDSAIGDLSDSFIRWLQEGIQTLGSDAVERLVPLHWVRERLFVYNLGDGGEGFLGQITYAFYDAPDGFAVRIGPTADTPTRLRLTLDDLRWRISAVYY
jgi:hypothetical protein